MNKFSKVFNWIISCSILLGFSQNAVAQQASEYTFTQSVDTYTPLTGGTVINTSLVDNGLYTVTLPSTFNYLGISQTFALVSPNGHLSFPNAAGLTSVGTTSTSVISGSFTNIGGAIAAFAADLRGADISNIRHAQVADEYVFQWESFKRYGVAGDDINFQIRLNTVNGTIKIVYGNMVSAVSTNYQPQVGLRGIAATDYNNRVVAATTGHWVNSTQGTVNTATCYFNGTTANTVPQLGTTFTYALPSCLSPSGIVATNIGETSATLSWNTARTVPANGYEYYISTSNTPPSNTITGVAASDTFAIVSNLVQNTAYYVWVRSICAATEMSQWGSVYTFRTNCGIANVPYTQDFQSATTPTLPSCTTVENLGSGNLWTTGTFSSSQVLRYVYNSSNPANTWFYTQGINLTAGQSYRISYKYARSSTAATEHMEVAYGTAANAAAMTTVLASHQSITPTTFTTNFVDFTPTTTDVYYFGFHATSPTNQYTLYVDDIVVDYSPTCFVPNALQVSNITATTVDVQWALPTQVPAGYEYYISTANTAPTATTIGVAVNALNTTIANLTPNTPYYVWVRSVCGANDASEWTASVTFTTLCTPISTLPWLENFDAATATTTFLAGRVPSCWTAISKASVMSSSTYIAPRSANNALAFQYGPDATTGAWAITPAFELQAGISYRFKFYYKNYSTSAFQSLQVALGSAATYADMNIMVGAPITNIVNTTYAEYYVDFTVPANGIYFLGMNVKATSAPMYMMVDDVTLDFSPTCLRPEALAISNITPNAATLSWNAPNIVPANGYEYYISTANTAPTATTTGTTVTGLTTVANGLVDNTTYYVWVRSICSATDNSEWTAVVSFTTPCLATNVPYLLDFESATTPTLPSCTSLENIGTTNAWGTIAMTTGAFSGSKVLRYLYNTTNPANTWFYTQGINLTAGQSYRISYDYGNNSAASTERFEVAYGTSVSATAMTTILATHTSNALNTRTSTFVDFVPPTTGVYYFGFHAMSAANQNALYIDNILVDESPTCFAVNGVTTSNITATTVDLAWTAPTQVIPAGYEYYISTSSVAPTAATTGIAVTGTTTTINGLNNSSVYYVWVRSVCSATDVSAWSTITTFATQCGVMDVPYLQNFDAVTTPALPICTSIENLGAGNNWTTATALGSNVLRYSYSYSAAANVWFYTNAINLVAGQSYRISYKYAASSTSGAENMSVAYGTAASATAMTNVLATHTGFTNTAYAETYVDFIPTTTGAYYFGFHAHSIANRYSIYLDDILIEESPTCLVPTQVAVSNVTGNTTTITWEAPLVVPAQGYEYYISTVNTAPDLRDVGIPVTSTSVQLTNLNENTTYYVWVRSICSATDASVWTSRPTFFYTGACLPTGVGNYYVKTFTTTGAVTNINYSASTGGVGYIDQMNTLLTAFPGSTISYSFTPSSGTNYYYIWIDWNNDFDFDDAGEMILSSTMLSNYNGTFTIDPNQPSGNYRMRIANSWSGVLTPCGHATNGVYIDFTLNVRSSCQNPITLSTAVNNICNGSRGTATVVATTPNPSTLNYLWSNGQTTATATDLSLGFHSVTVSDGAFCTEEAQVEILSSIVAAATEQLSGDCGDGSGAARVVAVGIGNLSYTWSNGATSDTITALSAGTYTVTVTDNICQKIADVEIAHNNVFDIVANVSNENTEVFGNGTIAIVNPLNDVTYVWSNGVIGTEISNLIAGDYTVTATDVNGCFVENTYTVQLVTGVNSVELSAISLYPNPTANFVNLAGLPVDAKVIVVNSLGQVVLNFVAQNEIEQIDLSTFAPATYWIRIEAQNTSTVLPVVRIK